MQMEQEQTIEERLRSVAAPGMRLGLERIQALMRILGHPEQSLKTVHIAGTNGKGSCSTIISEVLRSAGWNTGIYLSPHIHSYRERFIFNGQPVAYEDLDSGLDTVFAAANQLYGETGEKPTEFELLTAFCFLYFDRMKPDLLILETGLGGVYDATNIARPELSLITSISLDHTAMLGHSLAAIAANKAGIIKAHTPVAAGEMPAEALDVVKQTAARYGSRLLDSHAYDVEIEGYDDLFRPLLRISGPFINARGVRYGLRGRHQLNNLRTSLAALEELQRHGFRFTEQDITQSLPALNMPGRLELLQEDPPVFLDVGHNPEAARAINAFFGELFPSLPRVMLGGYLDDKDRDKIFQILAPGTRRCIITRPLGERSHGWRECGDFYRQHNQAGDVACIENIAEALDLALSEVRAGEYLLATGSFYLAGTVRQHFGCK